MNNYASLTHDSRLYQIALLANEQIRVLNYTEARYSLWELYKIDNHLALLLDIMETLSTLAQGDKKVIAGIIEWLTAQNNLFHTNIKPNNELIAATVSTLGRLKEKDAFPILFKTRILGYSAQITKLAEEAIFSLDGDPKLMLMDVIDRNPVIEKWYALNMGLTTNRLSDAQKAELAAQALDVALHKEVPLDNPVDKRLQRDIRFVAAKALADRKWSKATPLVIEHLNTTVSEYDRSITRKDYLIDAISALGNMGTREAAERLSNYLESLNNYTENGKHQDDQVVLSVIVNLGILGDKLAFPNLSYTQYLNYSDNVKKAADDAIAKLKW